MPVRFVNRSHGGDPSAGDAASKALHRGKDQPSERDRLRVVAHGAVLPYVLPVSPLGLTMDGSGKAGGCPYLEQWTPLWLGPKNSGGPLSSSGVDLRTSAFAPHATGGDALSFLGLALVGGILAGVLIRAVFDGEARRWFGGSFLLFAAVLFHVGVGVRHPVTVYTISAGITVLAAEQERLRSRWPPRHRKFRSACRDADRLEAAGRPAEAAALKLDATTALLRTSGVGQLTKNAHEIQRTLVTVMAKLPSAALAAFADLVGKCPRCISRNMAVALLAAWVRSPQVDRFEADWATILKTMREANHDPLAVLLDACRRISGDELTETFRRGLTAFLRPYLDSTVQLASGPRGRAPFGGSPAFELLDLVGPRNLPRGDQVCALGDVALARASLPEAFARYEAAVDLGSTQAGQRLAYYRARDGHRSLLAGDMASAQRQFSDAWGLHKDSEYAFLEAIARLLGGGVGGQAGLSELERLDGTGAPAPHAAFWRALAHLRRGEEGQAVVLLRQLQTMEGGSSGPWGPTEEGAALLAVLEGNDHALVGCAQRLVKSHGAGWLQAGPTDPWPMMAAVARHDRALLSEMVALVGDPDHLPAWVRVADAHVLLARSADLLSRGLVGQAAGDLEMADRLLSR